MEIRNRESLVDELTAVMRGYEAANNTHDIQRVLPYIAKDATCWFSDGSHDGRDQVRAAIRATFHKIRDEELSTVSNVSEKDAALTFRADK